MGSVFLSVLLALGAVIGGGIREDVWVDRETSLMGARLYVEIEATAEPEAQRVIDRIFDTVAALEKKLATGAMGSELSALRSADLGAPVSLTEETFRLLAQTWNLADRTDGAFEPTVGPLLDAWTARDVRDQPAAAELYRALASVGRRCFDLSPASRTIARHCPDAWIDGGGFGKGAALAAIEDVLVEEAIDRARIDFGGQLLIRGVDDDARTSIEIADPRQEDRVAFEWPAQNGSITTSSQSLIESETDDRYSDRVLDPHTGLPIEAWGSVTVRSDDPVEADAIATALFVMGPKDGIRWLAARPEIDAIFLVIARDTIVACGSEDLLRTLTPLSREAVRSTAPLVSEALRSCPQ